MAAAKKLKRRQKANRRRIARRKLQQRKRTRAPTEHRPKLFRRKALPADADGRASLATALTTQIAAMHAHLLRGNAWRDRRRLWALEAAIHQRGEVLEALRMDAPDVRRRLCTTLDLNTES